MAKSSLSGSTRKKAKRKNRKKNTKIEWDYVPLSIAFKKSDVPDFAIVPRCLMRSFFVIPMPVSVMWRT